MLITTGKHQSETKIAIPAATTATTTQNNQKKQHDNDQEM